MELFEIVDVALAELDVEQLRGRNIEAPKTDSEIDSDKMLVVGWVLGRSSPALTIEVVHDGTVLQSVPIDVQRPDVDAAFPEASEAEQSGFRTTVAVPNSGELELLVRAVLQNEETVPLGIIRARQRQGDKEQNGESSVQDRSGLWGRFFQRALGRGGG